MPTYYEMTPKQGYKCCQPCIDRSTAIVKEWRRENPDLYREQQAELRQERRVKGLCLACGKTPEQGYKSCRRCIGIERTPIKRNYPQRLIREIIAKLEKLIIALDRNAHERRQRTNTTSPSEQQPGTVDAGL